MANSNYKPICVGGGGECVWIVTTTDKLPNPGIEGKIYICRDTAKWYCWVDTGYQEVGIIDGQKYDYPTRATFPAQGEQGKYYIDGATGEKYIWSPNVGYPVYQLPNFLYLIPRSGSVVSTPPTNALYPTANVSSSYPTNWFVVRSQDSKGPFITAECRHIAGSGAYSYDLSMTINFKDPANSAAKAKSMIIYPRYAYYDPDDIKIDLNQLQVPSGPTFTIFLPKSYNITKWTSNNFLGLIESGINNYAFYQTDEKKGSYIKVS